MDEFIYYGNLLSIYKDKDILTKNVVEIYSLYYEENLSMQEIADLKKVSKSYISNIINTTSKRLENLESNFKLFEKKEKIKKIIELNDINLIKIELNKLIEE